MLLRAYFVSLYLLQIKAQGKISKQPSYFVLAPTKIRPDQDISIAVTVLRLVDYSMFTVRAEIRYRSSDRLVTEICSTQETLTRTGMRSLTMKTPAQMQPGNYTLRVSAYSDPELLGQIFVNETKLFFDPKQIPVFIFTPKAFYFQGQTVRIRIVTMNLRMEALFTVLEVRILNPTGRIMKEWYGQHAINVLELQYPLSNHFLEYGVWTVQAVYRGYTYSKTFVAEEFTTSMYEGIVIVAVPVSIYHSDKALSGSIRAVQQNVYAISRGNATISVEFFDSEDQPVDKLSPLTLQIKEFKGMAKFAFTNAELSLHAGGKPSLLGKHLRVRAEILDWSSNQTAVGWESVKVISDSVRLKFLGGNVWTFKPNVPFKVMIALLQIDGAKLLQKYENHTVELTTVITDSKTGETTTAQSIRIPQSSMITYWLRPSSNTERIMLKASFGGKLDTQQTLVATKYWSPNNHYIHISTSTKTPAVSSYIVFNIETNAFTEYCHYSIVSLGVILQAAQLEMNSRTRLLSIPVTIDMVPSAKIVVFYITPDGQIIADSLVYHVDATKGGKYEIKLNRAGDLSSGTYELELYSDPGALLTTAINKADSYAKGYRNSLNWEIVYEELLTFEDRSNSSIRHYWKESGAVTDVVTAATPTFAHDANSTFYYAGLYIFTDANISAVYTLCNTGRGLYPCKDGLSCYTANQICDGAAACSRDHRDEMGCPLYDENQDDQTPKLYDDFALWRSRPVKIARHDLAFGWNLLPQSHLGFAELTLRGQIFGPPLIINGFAFTPRLTIAEGLSGDVTRVGRRCIGLVNVQDRVRLGEILIVNVHVKHFYTEAIDVLISIPASDDYSVIEIDRDRALSSLPVQGEHQVLVSVEAGQSRLLNIPVRPERTGTIRVLVNAVSSYGDHTVTKAVTVTHHGVKDWNITSYQVDLRIANSERLPDLWLPVAELAQGFEDRLFAHVPGSPKSHIYVVGDIIGVASPTGNLDTDSLLSKPQYSGGEAAFNFAVKLYDLNIRRTLGAISTDRIAAMSAGLNTAMQEFLSYSRPDGSWIQFRWTSTPSTWLAATVLEVMIEALTTDALSSVREDNFRFPEGVLNITADWLVGQQDKSTGMFRETGSVHNRIYQSKTNVVTNDGIVIPANLGLTGFCVASLKRAAGIRTVSESVLQAIELGAEYLAGTYREIEDPFEMAIVTYALQTAGKGSASELAYLKLRSMQKQANRMTYWSNAQIPQIELAESKLDTILRILPKQVSSVGAYTVTATSYALLAYVENRAPEVELESIQMFLQEQHINIGGFYSSQDTLVAMRALRELAKRNQDRVNYDMTFTFTSDQDENWRKVVTLNQENWFDLQKIETPSHWGSIQTDVKGHGIALVQMWTTQNFDFEQTQLRQPEIENVFDLGDFTYDIRTSGFNHSSINYKLCPRWNGPGDRSGMSVMEVDLPSGYKSSPEALIALVEKLKSITALRAAETDYYKNTFYFDNLNRSRSNCVEFSAYRSLPVSNLAEHTSIKVYEYYEPGNFLLTFYKKFQLQKLTVCLVCGSYQCPYCPHYNGAPPGLSSSLLTVLSFVLSGVILKYTHGCVT